MQPLKKEKKPLFLGFFVGSICMSLLKIYGVKS